MQVSRHRLDKVHGISVPPLVSSNLTTILHQSIILVKGLLIILASLRFGNFCKVLKTNLSPLKPISALPTSVGNALFQRYGN